MQRYAAPNGAEKSGKEGIQAAFKTAMETMHTTKVSDTSQPQRSYTDDAGDETSGQQGIRAACKAAQGKLLAGKKQQQAHTLRKPINYGGSKASIPAIDAITRVLGSPSRAKVTPKRLSFATKVQSTASHKVTTFRVYANSGLLSIGAWVMSLHAAEA